MHAIDEMLEKINKIRCQRIFQEDLGLLLQKLNQTQRLGDFQPDNQGANLAIELKKSNGLAVEILMEYLIVEEYGREIMIFLENEFGRFNIIEHFQSFYRIKLDVNVSVGKLFGVFEEYKNRLNISSYSIKQATIEQIFNMFASEQVMEIHQGEGENAGENVEVVRRRSSVLDEFENEARRSVRNLDCKFKDFNLKNTNL